MSIYITIGVVLFILIIKYVVECAYDTKPNTKMNISTSTIARLDKQMKDLSYRLLELTDECLATKDELSRRISGVQGYVYDIEKEVVKDVKRLSGKMRSKRIKRPKRKSK